SPDAPNCRIYRNRRSSERKLEASSGSTIKTASSSAGPGSQYPLPKPFPHGEPDRWDRVTSGETGKSLSDFWSPIEVHFSNGENFLPLSFWTPSIYSGFT